MAGFGARYIRFAPFAGDEPAAALPKYGEAVAFGGLSKAELTITTVTGSIYGDDVLDEKVDEFGSGTLNVETTDMSLEAEAAIYGSTLDNEKKEIVDNTDDEIPFGGITYIKVLLRKGKKVFRAYYLPKVKAGFSTDTAQTKNESISLSATPSTFTVLPPNAGDWRYRAEFTTEAEAKTWCDGKLAPATEASQASGTEGVA